MEDKFTKSMGFSFASPIVAGGVIASFIGFISLAVNPIFGIGLLLFGVFLWSSRYGVQIDFKKGEYRDYGSMYGIKRGEWKTLNKMRNVCILKGRSGHMMYSRANQSTSVIDDRYEVCLLNENHRRKFVVKKIEDIGQAQKFASLLAAKMGSSVVKYNPIVSEKTRNRR